MLNILNDRISKEYGILSSYWEIDVSFNTIVIKLTDGHETKIKLQKSEPRLAYDTIEKELTSYYLLKSRKDKIKKITKQNLKNIKL